MVSSSCPTKKGNLKTVRIDKFTSWPARTKPNSTLSSNVTRTHDCISVTNITTKNKQFVKQVIRLMTIRLLWVWRRTLTCSHLSSQNQVLPTEPRSSPDWKHKTLHQISEQLSHKVFKVLFLCFIFLGFCSLHLFVYFVKNFVTLLLKGALKNKLYHHYYSCLSYLFVVYLSDYSFVCFFTLNTSLLCMFNLV